MNWLSEKILRFGQAACNLHTSQDRRCGRGPIREWQWRLQRLERLEARRLLSIGGADEPDWLPSPAEVAIESAEVISPDEPDVSTFMEIFDTDDAADVDLGWTLAPDSAEVVSDYQVVEFDLRTRTQRVFPLDESLKQLDLLNLLPEADSEPGFEGIGIGPWATETPAPDTPHDLGSVGEEAMMGDDPTAASDPGVQSIFAPEDRVRVANHHLTDPVWRRTGRLWTAIPGLGPGGCSGSMIDEFVLLTAGHCVHYGAPANPASWQWANQVVFSPGQDWERIGGPGTHRSEYQPYGEALGVQSYSLTGWINHGDFDFDMAWVRLDRNIGNYTGWFDYGYENDNAFYNDTGHTMGYPGDLTPTEYDMYQVVSGHAADNGITTHQLHTDTIDIMPGQSGSSLYYFNRLRPVVHGVVSHHVFTDLDGNGRWTPGEPQFYNAFTRMTSRSFRLIRATINTGPPPVDRPDLVDYDTWFNCGRVGAVNCTSENASFSRSLVTPGAPATATARIRNNGTAAAGPFQVSFYASLDTTITATDLLIGTTWIVGLDPFQDAIATWMETFPLLPPNTYHVGWIIDSTNRQAEFDETNNTGVLVGGPVVLGGHQLTVTGTPDLRDDGGSGFSPVSLEKGDPWSVWANIVNGGDGEVSDPFEVAYYASTDAIITTDDYLLGSHTITTAIPAGGSVRSELNILRFPMITVPAGATYTVGWIIDAEDTVFESDETNNTAVHGGYPLTVLRDPRVRDVDLVDAGDDFSGFSPRPPTTISPGDPFSVWSRVLTVGTEGFTPFGSVHYFLSTNTTISLQDYALGGVTLPDVMMPGDVFDARLDLDSLPSYVPDGTYWVGWTIYIQYPERDETNNSAYHSGYQLTVDNMPDLLDGGEDQSDFFPKTVTPGDPGWQVSSKIRNGGTGWASTGARVDYYASTDPIITPADYFLGSDWVSARGPGAAVDSQFAPSWFPDTVPAGEYWVGWIIDAPDQVAESDETNNTGLDDAMLTVNRPDLYDEGEVWSDFSPKTVTPGEAWETWSWTVLNGGSEYTDGYVVEFFASTDTTITADDYFLGWHASTGWARTHVGLTGFPGIPPGEYYVGWIIDTLDNVDERDEANNTGYDDAMLTVLGVATPEIHGRKWNDLNGDGVWDSGEVGLSGWTIYLDINNNRRFDLGVDVERTTAFNGAYSFGGLPPGTYYVREVQKTGWVQTAPVDEFYTVVLSAGSNVIGRDFGNQQIPSQVVGRHVFYNNSAWDDPNQGHDADDAVAPDKTALLPGQSASRDNYTSYSRGINGIMVDIRGLPPEGDSGSANFQFDVGNNNDPGTWTPVATQPTVSVRRGDGIDGSDRLTLIWPDNVIQNQWLKVTVLAENTGLVQDDVFYFGNAIGESGNSTTDAKVNAYDMLAARDNQRNFLDPAPIDFNFDYDRNARVDAADMLIARNNQTHFLNALRLITVPDAGVAGQNAGQNAGEPPMPGAMARDAVLEQALNQRAGRREGSLGRLDWLREFEPAARQQRPAKSNAPAEEAVDRLLTVH